MTKADLIKSLETVPDDAIIAFRVWFENGGKYFESQLNDFPVNVHEGVDGKKFAVVAYADNCIAHTLYMDWDRMKMRRFHERDPHEIESKEEE